MSETYPDGGLNSKLVIWKFAKYKLCTSLGFLIRYLYTYFFHPAILVHMINWYDLINYDASIYYAKDVIFTFSIFVHRSSKY